jgi:hypothetical protein
MPKKYYNYLIRGINLIFQKKTIFNKFSKNEEVKKQKFNLGQKKFNHIRCQWRNQNMESIR